MLYFYGGITMDYENIEDLVLDKLTDVLSQQNPILKGLNKRSILEGKVGKDNLAYVTIRMFSSMSVGFVTPTINEPHYYSTQVGDFRGHGYDLTKTDKEGISAKEIYEREISEAKRKPNHVLAEGVENERFGWFVEKASYAELQQKAAVVGDALASSKPEVLRGAHTQQRPWYARLLAALCHRGTN